MSPDTNGETRILIIRLTSLGDVLMAGAALESFESTARIDWVVSSEYVSLLEGHPRIARVWGFDRSSGFAGWLALWRQLRKNRYVRVVDLHRSLRSRIARFLFAVGSADALQVALFNWKVLPKQRLRLVSYYLFKGLWPKRWRPAPLVQRYSECASGSPSGRPDFSHLLKRAGDLAVVAPELEGKKFICVMPASRWRGKEWDPRKYAQFIERNQLYAVVLGTSADRASAQLLEILQERGIACCNGIGRWKWPELARVVASSRAMLSGDTGLAHFAESLGTRAWVLWGPTHPEMGFGMWRDESVALGKPLWCRPCGKDGNSCFRPIRKHLCMSSLEVDEVESQLRKRGELAGTNP